MNNDLVWGKGSLSKTMLLKLKPLMCICKTGITRKRQQIVEPSSVPQGSCHKCQKKIENKLVVQTACSYILLIYHMHLPVAIKSGNLLNMLADISTKQGITEQQLNTIARANKMGQKGNHLQQAGGTVLTSLQTKHMKANAPKKDDVSFSRHQELEQTI